MNSASAITGAATIDTRPAIWPEGRQQRVNWQTWYQADGQGVEVFPILETTWRASVIEKLSRFRSLPPNWNSYGSPPPSLLAIQRAIGFVSSLLDDRQARPRVTPVSGGGIQFDWSLGEREIELEFLSDGTVQYILASDRNSDGIEGKFDTISVSDIARLLDWLVAA